MKSKINPETELALKYAVENTFEYCSPDIIENGVITVPTREYQEGWKAALVELYRKNRVVMDWFRSLPDDKRIFIESLLRHPDLEIEESDGKVSLQVNCNDLFIWGSGEAEALPDDQLPLLAALLENDQTGMASQKWCCIRRNMQPQRPLLEIWKRSGVWDAELEALPRNPNDQLCPPTCHIHRPEDAAALRK